MAEGENWFPQLYSDLRGYPWPVNTYAHSGGGWQSQRRYKWGRRMWMWGYLFHTLSHRGEWTGLAHPEVHVENKEQQHIECQAEISVAFYHIPTSPGNCLRSELVFIFLSTLTDTPFLPYSWHLLFPLCFIEFPVLCASWLPSIPLQF